MYGVFSPVSCMGSRTLLRLILTCKDAEAEQTKVAPIYICVSIADDKNSKRTQEKLKVCNIWCSAEKTNITKHVLNVSILNSLLS